MLNQPAFLPSCRYGIRDVRVLAASARAIVQDCAEAEDNTDARDKFFMYVCLRVVARLFCQHNAPTLLVSSGLRCPSSIQLQRLRPKRTQAFYKRRRGTLVTLLPSCTSPCQLSLPVAAEGCKFVKETLPRHRLRITL